MRIFLLFLTSVMLFGWEMQGFLAPKEVDGIIYCYRDGELKKVSQVEGGEACWVNGGFELDEDKKDTYEWKEGWNFVTPIFYDWDMDDKFRGNVTYAWKYKDNKWMVYNILIKGLENFNSVKIKEGVWVYVPEIVAKINTQPLFCKNGECSKIITANDEYIFSIKAPQNDLKIAISIYRYSNDSTYNIGLGPMNPKELKNIPMCVEKFGAGGSCATLTNDDGVISYKDGYLIINAQKIVNKFNKTIPTTQEKLKVKLYIEGFDLKNFVSESFGTLGIEGFGIWVSLKDSKRVEFEMEVK